ncbi:hypothetical protein H4217_005856 [Coemansia sp. RSA 1939]|nr:hypothetical protein H4217_005856 [Coemansia sp. RSA 1939]KAJ2615027.1 hypothetical protein EV177_001770 [Coemansia sp. RSA 1804]
MELQAKLQQSLAHSKRPRTVVRGLRAVWVAAVVYGEVGVYYWRIGRCRWPEAKAEVKTDTEAEADAEAIAGRPTRVAIVADAQIVDHYSYGQTGMLLRIVEFFTDIYVRKAYLVLQDVRQPAIVVNLGDLMDGGRELPEGADEAWLAEYARFRSVFRNRAPAARRVFEMAGNHDIGIGNTVVPHALSRFHRRVGATNQLVAAGGHRLALVDTLTLESDDPAVRSGARRLVEQLRIQRESSSGAPPTLLFSHVPLWRAANTPCGLLRQSKHGALLSRRGYQFRDQLQRNTTEYLLEAVRPQAVFSGDDHDTCSVTHPMAGTSETVAEHTIGAFGWASGVPVASYALLTLSPGAGGAPPAFALQHCFLPHQLGIYKAYVLLLAASLALLARACWWRRRLAAAASAGGAGQRIRAQAGMRSRLSLLPDVLRAAGAVALVAAPAYVACILYFYVV